MTTIIRSFKKSLTSAKTKLSSTFCGSYRNPHIMFYKATGYAKWIGPGYKPLKISAMTLYDLRNFGITTKVFSKYKLRYVRRLIPDMYSEAVRSDSVYIISALFWTAQRELSWLKVKIWYGLCTLAYTEGCLTTPVGTVPQFFDVRWLPFGLKCIRKVCAKAVLSLRRRL